MLDPLPAMVADYQLDDSDPVGAGGMAARHVRTGRPVTLHIFDEAADLNELRARLRRAVLVDHPGLLCLHGLGEVAGPAGRRLWFAVERGSGAPLDAVGAQEIDPQDVLAPLLEAVAALHAAGLAHGAIAPDQIWLEPDGQVRLAGLCAPGVGEILQPAGRRADLLAVAALARRWPAMERWAEGVGARSGPRTAAEARRSLSRAPELRHPPPHDRGYGLVLAGLRAPRLVGRSSQLAALRATLHRVEIEGVPRVAALVGPGGAGVGLLASTWIQEAEATHGVRVLRLTHTPEGGSEEGIPAALRRLGQRADGRGSPRRLRSLLDRLRRLRPDARGLLVAQAWPGSAAPRALPLTEEAAFAELLAELSRVTPVILWVEDAQWAAPALGAVAAILAGPREGRARVLVLLSVRGGQLAERPVESGRLRALLEDPRAGQLAVAAPTVEEVGRVLREGFGLGPGLSAQLATHGQDGLNRPVAAAQEMWRAGALAATPEGLEALAPGWVPPSLAAMWGARLDRILGELSPEARTTIELAAAGGRVVEPIVWRRRCQAMGLHPDHSALDALVDAGLARLEPNMGEGAWSFVHWSAVRILLRLAGRDGRLATLQRACVTAIVGSEPEDGWTRGRFPVLPPASALAVMAHLRAAGQPTLALGAARVALEALARVGERRVAEPILRAVDVLLEDLRDRSPDRDRVRIGLVRAELARLGGDARRAEALAARSWTVALRAGWSDLEDRAKILLARLAFEDGRRVDLPGEGPEEPHSLAWVHLAAERALTEGQAEAAARWVEELARRAPDSAHAQGQVALLRARLALARGADEGRWLDRAATAMERARSRLGLGRVLLAIGDRALRAGSAHTAHLAWRTAWDCLEAAGVPTEVPRLLREAEVALAREAWREARRAASPARELLEQGGDHVQRVHLCLVLGLAAAGLEDRPAATENLRVLESLMGRARVDLPDLSRLRHRLADLAALRGWAQEAALARQEGTAGLARHRVGP